MLRWWDNEDLLQIHTKDEDENLLLRSGNRSAKSVSSEGPTREWKFIVIADTSPGETVCVTGNCHSLGNWQYEHVLPLKKEEDSNIWSGVADVPLEKDVHFRYCVCIVADSNIPQHMPKKIMVRRWETNLNPRNIEKNVKCVDNPEPQEFGYYDNHHRIERGWLTTETAIQLKLFNNPIIFWKRKLHGKKIYVKVTPVNLTHANNSQENLDETFSLETMEIKDVEQLNIISELAVLNESERDFRQQEQFGRPYNQGDFMTFQIQTHSPEILAVLIDFYTYGSHVSEGEPPYHIGFTYMLLSSMKNSEGQVVAPITSVRHRPIGQITVEYLIVKPITKQLCDMKTSLQKQWKDSWHGLDVGHRGSGSSFKGEIKQCSDVRENTIASLKNAASHGADFVEFDVQLTRDLVPVLYHDFHVCISMKKKLSRGDDQDMLQLPVKDLSLDQLHLLKDHSDPPGKVLHFCPLDLAMGQIYHLEEGKCKSSRFFDEDLEEHQPFPTLKQALEVLDSAVGFNIELKWTMQLKDGTYELYHPFDLNLYLDIVLETVLEYAGTRNIVFSCFHPDICSMIRLKQNKYPVMFLTQGVTDKYPAYHDERCQSVLMAVHYALGMGILGINAHTEDILRDSSQVNLVKQAGLVLFCWGDDNNDVSTIRHLKDLGLHAIIYDRINEIGAKEVKESIFRIEARESERMVIRAAAEKAAEKDQETSYFKVDEPHFLDMEKAKMLANPGSVASCVSLWSQDSKGQSTSITGNLDETTQVPEVILSNSTIPIS